MSRTYERWAPQVGEKLTGNILYFANPDGSYVAVVRSNGKYFLLPVEVAEAFSAKKPEDGVLVEIDLTNSGFRYRLL